MDRIRRTYLTCTCAVPEIRTAVRGSAPWLGFKSAVGVNFRESNVIEKIYSSSTRHEAIVAVQQVCFILYRMGSICMLFSGMQLFGMYCFGYMGFTDVFDAH